MTQWALLLVSEALPYNRINVNDPLSQRCVTVAAHFEMFAMKCEGRKIIRYSFPFYFTMRMPIDCWRSRLRFAERFLDREEKEATRDKKGENDVSDIIRRKLCSKHTRGGETLFYFPFNLSYDTFSLFVIGRIFVSLPLGERCYTFRLSVRESV